MDNSVKKGGGSKTLNVQAKSWGSMNQAGTVQIDLGSVKTVVACSAGASQRRNDHASTTLVLSYGTSGYNEQTIGSVSVPDQSQNVVTTVTEFKARYIQATNTSATWNSVHLSVVYE